MVQQNSTLASIYGTTIVSVTLPSNVRSGDVLVVGINSNIAMSMTPLTDSLGSSFSLAGNSTGYYAVAAIYYANVASSGQDTVSTNVTICNYCGWDFSMYVLEISGVTTSGLITVTGHNTGVDSSTTVDTLTNTSLSFPSGAFLVGMVSTDAELGISSFNSSTGFTGVSATIGSFGLSGIEYASSGVTSPTSFPATLSVPGFDAATSWAEIGIALPAIPSAPQASPTGAQICQRQAPGRCSTSFVGFNVTSGGKPVDANVTISAENQVTQIGSTQPIATFNDGGTTRQTQYAIYEVNVNENATYVVTLPDGQTISGSVSNPKPWTVVVVNVSG